MLYYAVMSETELPLYSEILPNLWQGGTAEENWVNMATALPTLEDPKSFDTVVTLTTVANPMGYHVKELRFGFPDAELFDEHNMSIEQVADWTYQEWKSGNKVLIRCQAGINRSGLIMALVLMREGLSANEAIELIRQKRSEFALSNIHFQAYLLNRTTS